MKTILLTGLFLMIPLSSHPSYGPELSTSELKLVDRCAAGHLSAAGKVFGVVADPYAPTALSPSQLCRIAFNHDQGHPDHFWVTNSLADAYAPDALTKSPEWMTEAGACSIGVILHVQRVGTPETKARRKEIAEEICGPMAL